MTSIEGIRVFLRRSWFRLGGLQPWSPEVDHFDVAALGGLRCVLLSWCQECLGVLEDAWEEAQEAEVFPEASAGFLFGVV
ncbi:hypothetical protein ABZZ46_17780 [Streptomyces rochei]|uniref:hypothetical protein n=1 Tax=Streptomyces rochei TaxID=1928 RepID=UPI0033AE1220